MYTIQSLGSTGRTVNLWCRPNVFDILINIVQHCCMMFEHVQIFVQHVFNVYIDLAATDKYVECVWPSPSSLSFNNIETC